MHIDKFLINFKLSNTSVLCMCLAIPFYIIFFCGTRPVIQGLAYTFYLFALLILCIQHRAIYVPKNFILFWVVFLASWCIPSLFNAMQPHLESDLVRLEILFVNVAYFSAIIFAIIQWRYQDKNNNLQALLGSLWLWLAPILFLLCLKTIYIYFLDPSYSIYSNKPEPFGVNSGVTAEAVYIFGLCSLMIKNQWLKIGSIILILATLILLDTRSLTIPFIFMIIVLEIFPRIMIVLPKKWKLLLALTLLLTALTPQFLYILDNLLNLSDKGRGIQNLSGRLEMWKYCVELIKSNPWLGIGYWANPFGYSIPAQFPDWSYNHPIFQIHNAFLRIWVENGFILSGIIICTTATALLRLWKNNQILEIWIALSILGPLCFSTRHLTLNLLNIILYTIVIIGATKQPKKYIVS